MGTVKTVGDPDQSLSSKKKGKTTWKLRLTKQAFQQNSGCSVNQEKRGSRTEYRGERELGVLCKVQTKIE
jgi:hypothetical protein